MQQHVTAMVVSGGVWSTWRPCRPGLPGSVQDLETSGRGLAPAAEAPAVLEVRKLCKRYGTGKEGPLAVDNVSLTLRAGENLSRKAARERRPWGAASSAHIR